MTEHMLPVTDEEAQALVYLIINSRLDYNEAREAAIRRVLAKLKTLKDGY
jgi:hypothetical protein